MNNKYTVKAKLESKSVAVNSFQPDNSSAITIFVLIAQFIY